MYAIIVKAVITWAFSSYLVAILMTNSEKKKVYIDKNLPVPTHGIFDTRRFIRFVVLGLCVAASQVVINTFIDDEITEHRIKQEKQAKIDYEKNFINQKPIVR